VPCAKLKRRGLEPFFRRKTGLLLDPYFSGTKLALAARPCARRPPPREKGELAFGTVDTWLLWQLTGGRVHATDVSNASRTLLLNLRTGDWDDALLRALRIPREVLPEVRASSGIFGEVSAVPALNGVPISASPATSRPRCLARRAGGRHGEEHLRHRAASSVAHRRPADRLEKPSAHHRRVEDRRPARIRPRGFRLHRRRPWCSGLRDGLGLIAKSVDVEKLAAKAADNGGVYLVRPSPASAPRIGMPRRAASSPA